MAAFKVARWTLAAELILVVLLSLAVPVGIQAEKVIPGNAPILDERPTQQDVQLQKHSDQIGNLQDQLLDLKSIKISERLTALEAQSELNKNMLITVLTLVVGLWIKQLAELVQSAKKRT